MSLQAVVKVAFEEIPVFGHAAPAYIDCSLYIFVLVLFVVHIDWGVVKNIHLCLCDVHFKTHSPIFIG